MGVSIWDQIQRKFKDAQLLIYTQLVFEFIWLTILVILNRAHLSRFVVATRDIEPLELVMWDNAAALGPRMGTAPVCLQVQSTSYCNH